MTSPAWFSMLAIIVSGLAYLRAGRQYVEDRRDRLLSKIVDLSVDVYQRDSDLVALEHRCAGDFATAQETRDSIRMETAIWRDALTRQRGDYDALHSEIALADGISLHRRLRAWRIQIDKMVPLQAGQMKDIAEHVRKSYGAS
jgi:hypothetical protein